MHQPAPTITITEAQTEGESWGAFTTRCCLMAESLVRGSVAGDGGIAVVYVQRLAASYDPGQGMEQVCAYVRTRDSRGHIVGHPALLRLGQRVDIGQTVQTPALDIVQVV